MDILLSPVTGLVDRAVNKLINESKFCCCFNRHVEDFDDERKHLVDALDKVQKDVETAKNAGEDIEENVNTWQRDAKSLIDEDTKTKQKCFFNLCPNCIWRYLRGKDLAQKKVRVQELIKSSHFTKVGRPAKGPGIKFHSPPGYIDFESRKSAKKQLFDALKERSNYLIGLQGMGGCGKSHLVKQVGNEVENSELKLFDRVIYVVVSGSPDFTKIRYDIGRKLGLKLEEGKEVKPEEMYNRLTNGEKILIILDDVWEYLKLREDIGIPNGEDHSGCCVLIVSRNKWVCTSMECQSLIELKTLSKEDAWTLFKQRAALSDDFSINFKKVGQEIVEECQSLPVAIAAVASTLRGRSLERWKSALTSLKSAQPIENTDEGLIKAYRSLELSYNYLKSNEAKKLFLLCSLFPEDYEIPIEDLTRFGIGLGLFGEKVHSYEILRGKVISALDELIDSCLVQQPSQKYVSIHDVIRDVAHWIANQEILAIMGPGRNLVKHSTIRYVYCQKMDAFPNWLSECIKLEFLSVSIDDRFDSVEIPKSFFERMEYLKVLQLAWHDSWYRLPFERKPCLSFPQSTNLPQNLRTLRVKGWELGAITSLENLEKLETLELSHCSVNELPEGIVKLEKLRLLGLVNCKLKKDPWEVISRLSKIEELYFRGNKLNTESKWGNKISFHAKLFDKNNVVQELQRYQINTTMSDRGNLYLSEEDSTSRVLFVDYFPDFSSHATIIDWVKRAEILRLNNILGGYRSVTPDLVEAIGDMNELIQLTLGSCPEIECLIDTTSMVSSQGDTIFNKLAKLHLLNMDKLMELCHGTPPSDLFRELRELNISMCDNLQGRLFAKNLNLSRLEVLKFERCPMLKSLFTLSTAKSLVQLKTLELFVCDQLKDIIILNEQEQAKGEEIVDYNHHQHIYGSFFPKLNDLIISDSDQLEYIYPFSSVPALPSLMDISLESCRQLKYIIGPYPNKDQLLLQKDKEILFPICSKLYLDNLPNFISIFPESGDPTLSASYVEDDPEGRESEITALSGPRTPNSKWFGPMIQQLTFGNIRQIKLFNCPKLISLFTSVNETIFLEVLRIEKCDALRQLIMNGVDYHFHIKQGSVFPKLKQLQVQDCKLLEFIFPVVFSGNPASLEKTTNKYDSQDVEQIVKENADDQIGLKPHNQQVCFSSLAEIIVNNCGNLKCLFSISTDSTFPELQLLFVENNLKLKQVFASEPGRANKRVQVVLPKLKYLVLKELPSLDNNVSLGILLRPVEHCIVKGCPGLTFSSTTTFQKLKIHFFSLNKGNEFGTLRGWKLAKLIRDADLEDVESRDEEMVQSNEDSENDDSTPKDVETQVEEALESEMPSSEPQTAKATAQGIVQQCLMSESEEQLKEASIPYHQEINSIKEKRQESLESEKAMHKENSEELRIACKDQQEHRKTTFDMGVGAENIMENVELVPTLEKVTVQRTSIPSEKRNSGQDPLITGPHETSPKELASKDQQELRKTTSDMAADAERFTENFDVDPILEKAKTASSSVHSETRSSEQDPLVTCLHETSPKEFTVKEPKSKRNAVVQALEENKRTQQITYKEHKPSYLLHMKEPSNENKNALQISSTIPELKGSALTSVVTFPEKISPLSAKETEKEIVQQCLISEEPAKGSALTSVATFPKKTSRLISSIPKMNTASPPSSSSGLILQPEVLQELKTELDAYLNMSLEAIFESNDFDNVERIVNSLARGTVDIIQRNILEDLATRLKNFKECIPQAMNTKQSSFEFMSNYEGLNTELNNKLSKGQGKVRDLESRFSETCEEEYAIEIVIQQLIARRFEILAQKNSLASQLDQSAQEVSKDYEGWKALEEELKLSTDQWLKSKEVLAHANASWRVFKESL